MATKKELAPFFDLLHQSKDYKGEVAFFESLFKKFSKNRVERVLLVGCGSGGHLVHLLQGRYVFGVDVDSHLLDVCKEACPGVDLCVEDPKNFDLQRKFDAVIAPFCIFNHYLTEDEVRHLLSSFARHLDSGGLLIFDYMAPHQKRELELQVFESPSLHLARLVQWVPEQFSVRAERSYWVRSGKKMDFFVDSLKYLRFPPSGLVGVITKAGFKKVRLFNGYMDKSYKDAPVAVFCMVKK